ncbi:MAG: signal recognition particle protein [Rickettsiaceae bacterium]|nr:signal recognition particle protein [Rickettsiaceae bacterium]
MFSSLSSNFSKIFDRLRSSGALTKDQIEAALRDVRIALLEADVALPVVKEFTEAIKEKATGVEIVRSVTPAQMVIKVIHDELVSLLGGDEQDRSLNLRAEPPVSIMIVGLQGSGKTTSSGKLALYLKNQKKKVLLVSLDTYRPAAQEQLRVIAKNSDIDSLPIIEDQKPLEIVKRAIIDAKTGGYDVVIYDTAGRLHIDYEMIEELKVVKSLVKPAETILVADSLTGQDAVNMASEFDKSVDITGFILTRIDGDGRGGAALSIKAVTKKPIKFLGVGEKVTALEPLHPERLASRILGMGDVVSLVEKAASIMDEENAAKNAAKLRKGNFNMNDYLSQIENIGKMGGMSDIISMLPGIGKMADKIDMSRGEKIVSGQKAIILSMTKAERRDPMILNASRRKRIAAGSGTSVQDVNKLLKQFSQIRDMVKKASRMDFKSLMRSGIGKLFS